MQAPLSLTPFERLMVYDDKPGYPLTFSMLCEFVGQLDRKGIETALELVHKRHPLLQATVNEGPFGLSWVWNRSSAIPVCWNETGWTTSLNPYVHCGVRLTAKLGERSTLYFEFHHSCCDGDGAALFLLDFLKAYDETTGGRPRAWNTVDPGLLSRRGRIAWPKSTEAESALPWWTRLKLAVEFLTCLPEQICGDQVVDPVPRTFSRHVFDAQQTSLLLEKLKAHKSRLNDVGLALLFQTLARWQRAKTGSSRQRRIRVLMPTSVRELSDRRMGAANRTSFAFLTRRCSACLDDFGPLHQGIREETAFIRKARPDLTTLAGLQLADRLGVLKLLPLLPVSQSSAILTNMGDRSPLRGEFAKENGLLKIGDVLLESASGTPPVGRGTRLALATARVADRMSVSLRCDPATFSLEAEQELLDAYVQSWREWARI